MPNKFNQFIRTSGTGKPIILINKSLGIIFRAKNQGWLRFPLFPPQRKPPQRRREKPPKGGRETLRAFWVLPNGAIGFFPFFQGFFSGIWEGGTHLWGGCFPGRRGSTFGGGGIYIITHTERLWGGNIYKRGGGIKRGVLLLNTTTIFCWKGETPLI